MAKRNYGYWFFMMVLAFICQVSAALGDNEIKLSATTMRPGDFIKIVVNETPDSNVEVQFLGESKRLQFYNAQYLGFVAASYFTKPGVYTLSVMVAKDNHSYTRDYSIEISKRDFPEDRVVINEKTRKQILTPDNVNNDSKTTTDVRQKAQAEALPPLWQGKFIWPVHGKITTEFGRVRYMNNIEEGRHSGFDISAPTGTPVLACNRGKVIFAGDLNVTGLTVIVHHGMGLYTSYCHLSKIGVAEGEQVDTGTTIGQVGMTGLATGPHLHLTVRVDEICIDPDLILDKEISWN
jgi:murein DD-endopeptidase MepM/ murein hydrolase activator NlpD